MRTAAQDIENADKSDCKQGTRLVALILVYLTTIRRVPGFVEMAEKKFNEYDVTAKTIKILVCFVTR